jgi:deferrochelatase/peroxidase EfeB
VTAAATPGVSVDFRNVQATVTTLYRCPIARHLLFRFGGKDGGRAFLRALAGQVTMADFSFDATPDPLLNVGVTFNGLAALGVDPALLDEFDAIYKAGPDGDALGDVGGTPSDPASWWEGQFAGSDLHCIVHLYLRTDEHLDSATAGVRELASANGLTELIPRRDGSLLDGRSLGAGKLHFGYTDGISHPDISWDDVPDTPAQINFRNFLLGYATAQYGSAPAHGPAAELVRDSAYGTFRWLYQDVATFNRFLAAEGPKLFPQLSAAEAQELLAAKLLGRWRDGTPLVLSPDKPDPALASSNDFGYAADPDGVRCPFSAHIRVTNPRDEPLDPIVEGVPRVIRRGMPYGPPLEGTADDGVDRGIIGMFLCADLRRQVYTLTGWIRQNDFSPVYDPDRRTQDALVGNRAFPGTHPSFAVPGAGSVATLPDFVHTKGTAFLLYPSGSALKALAAA